MLPSRYLKPEPGQLKKGTISQIKHLQAPLKGLSLNSKLTTGDPLTAPILDNWVVEEDRIRVRPGTNRILKLSPAAPISAIIPYYGFPTSYMFASGARLLTSAGTVLETGYGGDDWSWTSFSNLGEDDYTVMVNGHDGVQAWDGGTDPGPAPIPVTNLSKANPAVCTVSSTNIGKFHNGQTVIIAGAAGAGMTVANGAHTISAVGSPANTFTLTGIDTSAAAAAQTTGVTADVQGSMAVQDVHAPPTAPWINVSLLDKVCSHMNRLWFADSVNLALYYLPLQSKTGELKYIPLNAIFRRGGSIRAVYPWTVDGGRGLDDQIVIFTDNGEAAIYGGVDPDADFNLVGIFRFDAPLSKNAVMQFGGDLYVLASTGLLPMTTLIRSETEQLGKYDKNVFSMFSEVAAVHRNDFGWGVLLDHHTGYAICNLPLGGGRYRQMVRFMPNPIWAQWSNLYARCWGWIAGRLLYATDQGEVFEVNELYLNDSGKEIRADVQFAWSTFGTVAVKQFKMALPYVISDGNPRLYIDLKVNYDMTAPANLPDVEIVSLGASWDTATWDVDSWAGHAEQRGNWQGVAALGRVGAPRFRVAIINCTFAISACDVIFESGAAVG